MSKNANNLQVMDPSMHTVVGWLVTKALRLLLMLSMLQRVYNVRRHGQLCSVVCTNNNLHCQEEVYPFTCFKQQKGLMTKEEAKEN